MAALSFKSKNITKQLVSSLKERTRDIIVRRFGLDGTGERKTLEAIGGKYKITRERVRQITNFAVNSIKEHSSFEAQRGVFAELKDIFGKKGKILSEERALKMLSGDSDAKNHIHFLLVLGDDFVKMKEDEEFVHRWTIDVDHAEKVHQVLRNLYEAISEDELISEKDAIGLLRKQGREIFAEEEINDETAISWLNISKIIGANALGEWGRAVSPNINPRGVRDLAFLVLRKEGSPLHFKEVAEKISGHFSKDANAATVHNELIKDRRFVLVGRGLYALSDWGYQTGTVRDIIKAILEADGAATKDEIIKKVLKERYVKENTILVNLQNRSFFRRNKEGRYLAA